MLRLHGTTLKIGNKILLKTYDISLPESGFLLITGENGCGKSTFLKSAAMNLSHLKTFKHCISFVSALQHYETSIPILGSEFYSLYSDQVWTADLNEKFGHLLNQRIDKMSSGELQALILISNLMRPSKLLVLDEPLSHLSKDWSLYFSEWFQKNKKNQLILAVSHQIDELKLVFDLHYSIKNQMLIQNPQNQDRTL